MLGKGEKMQSRGALYNAFLKEASDIAEDSLALAHAWCKEHHIPAKERLAYIKPLLEATSHSYATMAQREMLQEIADAISDVTHAIAFAAVEDEEALQKLEELQFTLTPEQREAITQSYR
jgi:hypothetical protein